MSETGNVLPIRPRPPPPEPMADPVLTDRDDRPELSAAILDAILELGRLGLAIEEAPRQRINGTVVGLVARLTRLATLAAPVRRHLEKETE